MPLIVITINLIIDRKIIINFWLNEYLLMWDAIESEG